MAHRSVVLVNCNRMQPPVAPLALDYIGDTLTTAGFPVTCVDMCLARDPLAELRTALAEADPVAVGVSFRNTDDCFWPSGESFLAPLQETLAVIREASRAPIVLGGCGFSIFPVPLLEMSGADLGIIGDGEQAFLRLATRLERNEDYANLPGLVHRDPEGNIVVNSPDYPRNLFIPTRRGTIDNARYLRDGAMGNVETKRGCPGRCIYCADPVAKGRCVRCRPPAEVADEIEALLAQGVGVLHFCDGEFNLPPRHALAICEEIIARGLGDRLQWYCYATVDPFPAELAWAMRRAGCVGVNFGADSGCDRILAILNRGYERKAIRRAVDYCRRVGITVMADLLIGGPGEDEASIRESIEFMKRVSPDRIGAATGVRVYPQTRLAQAVRAFGPLADNPNLRGTVENNEQLLHPVFYLDQRLGDDPGELVCELIAGDERFFPPPRVRDATNYNYNDNRVLQDAIAQGHRGAFWDILRRLARPDGRA